ncbi:exodeoxyribonuclease V subunit gamma [Leptospira sp. 96542]|nr:exodeoxyribonuclease V subunit gamma [Leptospira sp. 96542]
MAIVYHSSLNLLELTKVLSENLQKDQIQNPLKSPKVVVPNLNLIPWLRLNIPKLSKEKISANISYTFLEKSILDLVFENKKIPKHQRNHLVMGLLEVEERIFAYLYANRNRGLKEFENLSNYIKLLPRLYSLSRKLAKYFKDYELNRSGWIVSWAKEIGIENFETFNQTAIPKDLESDLYYQFEKKIFQDVVLKSNADKLFLKILSKASTETLVGNIHLFCLSNLSGTYVEFFKKITENNQNLNIHLYQYFSNIETNEIAGKEISDTSRISNFAKPQLYLNGEFSKYTKTKTNFEVTTQNYIIELKKRLLGTGSKIPYDPTDNTVRFWNAPSVYREVEQVAYDIMDRIWKSNGSLHLLDFSVLFPNISEYRPAVEWVFDGGVYIAKSPNELPVLQSIPYALTDVMAKDSSLVYRAIKIFFKFLSTGQINRNDILEILRNPVLIPEPFEEDIDQTLDQLGVLGDGSEFTNDPYTMEEALKRLALSLYLNEETSWDELNAVPIPSGSENFRLELLVYWANFKQFLNDLQQIPKIKDLNLRSEQFQRLFTNIFHFDEEFYREERMFGDWLKDIQTWVKSDVSENDYFPLLNLATDSLFSEQTEIFGNYLTSGVTVSLLQPMRPIPYKHIYILGLGEGKFPGSLDRSPINLRRLGEYSWDVNKKEIQESLLWETIFSASESITFSYVGKNTKEDKDFEPSSSVSEIMNSFENVNVFEIPLHNHSKAYESNSLPSFAFERNLFWNSDTKLPSPNFSDPNLYRKMETQNDNKKRYNLAELTKYVKDPLTYYLEKNFQMYHLNEDFEDQTEEHFSLSALERYFIRSQFIKLFTESLSQSSLQLWNYKNIELQIDNIIKKEMSKALFPTGAFALLEKNHLIEEMMELISFFNDWDQKYFQTKSTINFYDYLCVGKSGLKSSLQLDPLVLGSGKEIFLEIENVLEADGLFYWVYNSRIIQKPVVYSSDYHYSDYLGGMVQPYLASQIMSELGKKLIILPVNAKSGNKKISSRLEIIPKHNAHYIETILTSINSPLHVERKIFLNFILNHSNKETILSEEYILSLKPKWQNYIDENEKDILGFHPKLLKISPHILNFVKNMDFDFAVALYLPMILEPKFYD